jgi:hypothetical protein
MKHLLALVRHFVRFGESYLALPLALVAAIAALHLSRYATGRPSVVNPLDAVLDAMQGLLPLVFLLSVVGYVQTHCIGYRGERDGASLWDDVFDLCVFLILLFSFAWLAQLR